MVIHTTRQRSEVKTVQQNRGQNKTTLEAYVKPVQKTEKVVWSTKLKKSHFEKQHIGKKYLLAKDKHSGVCTTVETGQVIENLNTQFIIRVHLKGAICQAMQVPKLSKCDIHLHIHSETGSKQWFLLFLQSVILNEAPTCREGLFKNTLNSLCAQR